MQNKILYVALDPSLSNLGYCVYFRGKILESGTSVATSDLKGPRRYINLASQHIKVLHDVLFKLELAFCDPFTGLPWTKVVIISESPYGSKSYGAAVSVGVSSAIVAVLMQMVEYCEPELFLVNPRNTKEFLTGSKEASKALMITEAYKLFPDANWKKDKKGRVLALNQHMADALAALYFFLGKETKKCCP